MLNRATDVSDNCVSLVQKRVVAEFSSLQILIPIFWIFRIEGKGSRYCRYKGVLLKKLQDFIVEAKMCAL